MFINKKGIKKIQRNKTWLYLFEKYSFKCKHVFRSFNLVNNITQTIQKNIIAEKEIILLPKFKVIKVNQK